MLVVERQETIEDITEEINKHFQEDKAYGMLGYEKDYCKKGYPKYRPSQCRNCDIPVDECRVKYNYREQYKYPIVVISHNRLFMMSEKDEMLGALRNYREPNRDEFEFNGGVDFSHISGKKKRSVLLIDERPNLIENIPTNSETLDQFYSDVQKYIPDFESEAKQAIDKIRDKYAGVDKFEQIDPVEPNFSWTTDFIKSWQKEYLGDDPENIDLIYNIIREGGLYDIKDHQIYTTHQANVYWQDYSTFIFDGTAEIDPDYDHDLFYYAKIPNLGPYDNLTINVCMEENLSKTFYQKNQSEFIPKFSEDIKAISQTGKTYLVCYKNQREEFEEELSDIKGIDIEHYGSTKGANHLRENVNIVCTGILHKGEASYLSKKITLDKSVDSFESITTGRVRRFKDEDTEAIKIYDMVKDLVQEIFRTKLRDHSSDNEEVNAYLITRDAYIIDLLAQSFTGCRINRGWQPKALMSNRLLLQKFIEEEGDRFNAKTKLMRAFFDKYEDVELTNKDVCKVLDVQRASASRYLRLKK